MKRDVYPVQFLGDGIWQDWRPLWPTAPPLSVKRTAAGEILMAFEMGSDISNLMVRVDAIRLSNGKVFGPYE